MPKYINSIISRYDYPLRAKLVSPFITLLRSRFLLLPASPLSPRSPSPVQLARDDVVLVNVPLRFPSLMFPLVPSSLYLLHPRLFLPAQTKLTRSSMDTGTPHDEKSAANRFFAEKCGVATSASSSSSPAITNETPLIYAVTLLNPRQAAGASTLPGNPVTLPPAFSSARVTTSPSARSTAPPSQSSTSTPSPSPHHVQTAAIAGGIVGGILTIVIAGVVIWCLRGRFKFRVERVDAAAEVRPAVLGSEVAQPAAVYNGGTRERAQDAPPQAPRGFSTALSGTSATDLSVLSFDKPIPSAVLATQRAMLEKRALSASYAAASGSGSAIGTGAGTSAKPPRGAGQSASSESDDVGASLWNASHYAANSSVSGSHAGTGSVSMATGSSGSVSVRQDPATQMQLTAMAERVAQLESQLRNVVATASTPGSAASASPRRELDDDLPPDYS
ncbi:hypothetical protein GGX14DRAFT_578145 [Mycena pura]|uniref:Uncharacterized protein n=1 Tax=Mycena pura TaxID=153505 RepID=A0AAD6Y1M3_9AGAR|nr:hypothetical protein GGX14DRAFT_578145 [Mycena pura]